MIEHVAEIHVVYPAGILEESISTQKTGPLDLPELIRPVEFSYRQQFAAMTVVGFILVVIQVYNCVRQLLFGPSRQHLQRLLGGRKVVEIDC